MNELTLTEAARHLHADHAAFQRRFADLCERARSGDWHELDEVWGGFAADIERHLAFEEARLFPGYSERGPESQQMVALLAHQHAEFRRALDSLGLQIQLKEIRPPTIEAFTELLREHAGFEDETLYLWARGEDRSDAPRRRP